MAAMLCCCCAMAQSNEVKDNLIICNEGNWQSDNGQLSFYDATTGTLTNKWFRTVNNKKLGDTPNDIIQINDNLFAICVNWSNIIQYINKNGEKVYVPSKYYAPNNIFNCTYAPYYFEAIKMRFEISM